MNNNNSEESQLHENYEHVIQTLIEANINWGSVVVVTNRSKDMAANWNWNINVLLFEVA